MNLPLLLSTYKPMNLANTYKKLQMQLTKQSKWLVKNRTMTPDGVEHCQFKGRAIG
jgi:hypothetical protein